MLCGKPSTEARPGERLLNETGCLRKGSPRDRLSFHPVREPRGTPAPVAGPASRARAPTTRRRAGPPCRLDQLVAGPPASHPRSRTSRHAFRPSAFSRRGARAEAVHGDRARGSTDSPNATRTGGCPRALDWRVLVPAAVVACQRSSVGPSYLARPSPHRRRALTEGGCPDARHASHCRRTGRGDRVGQARGPRIDPSARRGQMRAPPREARGE